MKRYDQPYHDEPNVPDIAADVRKHARKLGIGDDSWMGMRVAPERRAMLDGIWAVGNSFLQNATSNKVQAQITSKLAAYQSKGWLGSNSRLFSKIAAKPGLLTAAFFSAVAATPYYPMFLSPFRQWHKERASTVEAIAPILKEMKDDGLPGSIGSINPEDNEVIYAQRMRINAALAHKSKGAVFGLGQSLLPSLTHLASKGLTNMTGDVKSVNQLSALIPGAITTFISDQKAEGDEEFGKQQGSCSALDMIIDLNKQLKKRDPKEGDLRHAEFTLPGAMRRQSANLTNYIAAIIEVHSADMERLKPDDYSHLRSPLKPQIREIASVLAEAVARGDLAPLSLVRLVGEGHIIKQQGRRLVDVADLKAQLNKFAGKQTALVEIDPKDYLGMATFKEKELKETFGHLEGNERAIFASFFPDAVLKQAGIADSEIKAIREETAPMYEKNLANLLAGIASQPEAELKAQGMADAEIKAIQQAAATLKEGGEKAVHSLRANAANPTGIELPLLNAAMGKISEPQYLGKMLSAGNKALEHAANDDAPVEGTRRRRHHDASEREELGEHTHRTRTRSDSAPFTETSRS